MKKIINVFTLGVFLISNIITPLTNFIYAEETETLEEGGDLSVVRDMENIGNDNEVIPQTAPEESGDTSKESVETPNPEDSQSEENITPDEQPSEESQGDEQVNKQEDNQEDNQSDESSVELADPTESHNSATTPVKDEEDNNDTSATQGEQSIDEDREIMGTCPSGQIHNDDLNITYTCTLTNNVPVYYGTDMDSTHRYNNNPINTITVFVPVEGETNPIPITMMDKNLGATSNDISSQNSYGELYQRGNNAPIKNVTTTQDKADYENYWPGHSYNNPQFVIRSADYWKDIDNTTFNNLWGGLSDTGTTTNINTFWGGIKNGKNRQGPCPNGYHVPSQGEWNALGTYWKNSKNSISTPISTVLFDDFHDTSFMSDFKLPYVGYRENYVGEYFYFDYDLVSRYRTSSPLSSNGKKSNVLSLDYDVKLTGTERTYGNPIRCFKDSPDIVVHEVTFHDDSGKLLGANSQGILKQLVEHGHEMQIPIEPKKGGGSEFLGWTKTLNGTDYFDFSTPVEENMDLYAKWICEEGYTEKEDKTGCEFIGYFDVNFNPNGGAFSGKAVDEALKITYSMNGPDEIIPIYNIQIPNKEPTGQTGWMFAGWYTKSGADSDWGEEFDISNPTVNNAYAKWLPFNDLEFNINGLKVILMDRNLGAESVSDGIYYGNGNYEDSTKLGFYYQWGNNYGFKNYGEVLSSSDRVDGDEFGPRNYFYSNKFIKSTRLTINENVNLWGDGQYYTPEIDSQGPCPSGYHIPSQGEWNNLRYEIFGRWKTTVEGQEICSRFQNEAQCFAYLFKLPYAGNRSYSSSNPVNKGYASYNRSSTRYYSDNGDRAYYMNNDNYNNTIDNWRFGDSWNWVQGVGMPIRCIKDSGKTIIFNTNGGDRIRNWSTTKWNKYEYDLPSSYNGNFAHKDPYMIFQGWYTTSEFITGTKVTNSTIISDNNSNVVNLYAKWECANGFILQGDKCSYPGKIATLMTGSLFNLTLTKLAIGPTNNLGTDKIKGFVWRDSLPEGINPEDIEKISIDENSDVPVYVWFDQTGYSNGEGIIYYTSEADKIFMNQNSSNMFAYMQGLTSLDLSNFDTSNVINMSAMFNNCSNLKTLILDGWDLSNAESKPGRGFQMFSSMFYNATSLEKVSMRGWKLPTIFAHALGCRTSQLCATTLQELDVTDWDLSKTTDIQGLFASSKTRQIIGLNTWDTSNVTNMYSMFQDCSNLKSLDLSNFDTSNVTNMNVMFNGCSNLTSLNLDNWDLSKMSSYGGAMFNGTTSLKTLSLKNWTLPENASQFVSNRGPGLSVELDWIDVSGWDLSKTTNLYGLFGANQTKKIIGLDTWDTSSIMNMQSMFAGSSNLTGLNLDNWDLSKSPDMTNIFSGSSNLKELSLKNWKIPTSFRNILGGNDRNHFSAEPNWIDVTNWDLSATEDLSGLFGDNKTREIRGLGTWDTSNVKDMSEMFAGAPRLTALDLSNWDTSNVENMTYMFVASSALKTIYASEKFVTTKATDVINSMFAYTALVGGQGTVYDWNHAGTDYAKIDGGPHNPGYFTQANSIRYDLDGGELQHPKTAYAPIGSFTLSEPTKEGYTFIGWTGSNGDVPQREVTIQQGTIGDLEFTANWEINKHQIIFDTDGGETLNPLEVEYNSELSGFQLPIPIRESYRFLGWEGLPNIMPDEDITIKALWERVNNEPQYSGGGGGGSSSAIDVAEKTIDNNKHNAADERGNDESRTPDGKQGDTDSSVEDNYSPEFIEAYNFAKTNGITTQSNIQKAKMNSPLTRIAMAKMLSYYAINVLGQEPDMSKTINFDDVSAKRDAEYDNGVTLAYQLGIMGQNMKNNKFRPNDEVTRAEFVTALSRMIYGMKDGTGKQKYYEPHMARLYNEGVINKADPKMKEKRGYVMIMLMRTIK